MRLRFGVASDLMYDLGSYWNSFRSILLGKGKTVEGIQAMSTGAEPAQLYAVCGDGIVLQQCL